MKVGIIGPGGSGKTTLFNALTGQSAQTGGSARKTHVAVVQLPDERLETIQKLSGRSKRVSAQITFSDVAGELTKPTREHGLDPELANMMKAFDAFAVLLGDFPEYVRGENGKSDPVADAGEIESDLILADLVVVENKMDRIKREPVSEIERGAIEKCGAFLDTEKPLRLLDLNRSDEQVLSSYSFLSRKPVVYVHNTGEEGIGKPSPAALVSIAKDHGASLVTVSAKIEMEIAQMESADRPGFLEAMGLGESALDRFVRASFEACSLISFFTTSSLRADESRAWTIERGSTAFEAAGKVHSDIQRGFIRAEVINYKDFVKLGGIEAAKAQGKIRLEGKDYIVQDSDIIQFRFNV